MQGSISNIQFNRQKFQISNFKRSAEERNKNLQILSSPLYAGISSVTSKKFQISNTNNMQGSISNNQFNRKKFQISKESQVKLKID